MILKSLHARLRGEDGGATVEFVVVFPLFLVLLLSAIETGVLITREAMLERAASMTVRDIRLDGSGAMTLSERKAAFCDDAILFRNCEDSVFFAFADVDTETWDVSDLSGDCTDSPRSVTPVTGYRPGLSTDLSVMWVCALFDPVFATTGLGAQLQKVDGEHYAQIVYTAFVGEPQP
jgi:hypothetical protein